MKSDARTALLFAAFTEAAMAPANFPASTDAVPVTSLSGNF